MCLYFQHSSFKYLYEVLRVLKKSGMTVLLEKNIDTNGIAVGHVQHHSF